MDQSGATVIATRSRDEIESAIRSFTDDDLLRLRKVSWCYASQYIEAEDLFQEAIVRALEGRRKCPVNIDVVKFLAEAMRSIAHGESEKLENRDDTDGESEILNPPDPSPSIEEAMIDEESTKILHDRILSLFEEGTPACDMVQGMMDDWSAEELREVMGLDKTAYASLRRLIRRRINKEYPEGWSHDRE